jgi:hypothetical protein
VLSVHRNHSFVILPDLNIRTGSWNIMDNGHEWSFDTFGGDGLELVGAIRDVIGSKTEEPILMYTLLSSRDNHGLGLALFGGPVNFKVGQSGVGGQPHRVGDIDINGGAYGRVSSLQRNIETAALTVSITQRNISSVEEVNSGTIYYQTSRDGPSSSVNGQVIFQVNVSNLVNNDGTTDLHIIGHGVSTGVGKDNNTSGIILLRPPTVHAVKWSTFNRLKLLATFLVRFRANVAKLYAAHKLTVSNEGNIRGGGVDSIVSSITSDGTLVDSV